MSYKYYRVLGTSYEPHIIATPLGCYSSFENILNIMRYGAKHGLDYLVENGNLILKKNPRIKIWLGENGVIMGQGIK
jgi:hypothetical protein